MVSFLFSCLLGLSDFSTHYYFKRYFSLYSHAIKVLVPLISSIRLLASKKLDVRTRRLITAAPSVPLAVLRTV
jgi:hypothetical protein